ncbi:MAG: YdcF family protein [Saccharofermentans sp.]|nr:YdcF family protein [Saccharofermentans sp.]
MRSVVKKILKVLAIFLVLLIVIAISINIFVCVKSDKYISSIDEIEGNYDFIIVLGCGIYDNSVPTPMLSDRLDAAISLYNQGVAPYLLMSGDHRVDDYNEVGVMKKYCIQRGIPEDAILLDDYGLSTYETMSRAVEVFGIKSAVIVTQRYHLYRAIYNANSFGIDCEGVIASGHVFREQPYYSLREVFARIKDFILCIAI